MSPRATRPAAKDAAAPATSRRRPTLPGRGRKGAATAHPEANHDAAAGTAGPKADGTGTGTVRWADLQRGASSDVPHMAMPRLMGQPAYARPPRVLAAEARRPFDPDDLPLEAFRNEEDQGLAAALARRADQAPDRRDGLLRPSSTGGLRAIAGRLFGARD